MGYFQRQEAQTNCTTCPFGATTSKSGSSDCTRCDLGRFIDAPVRTYSAGMRSRLGFSVAMLVDPDIVILDEVIRAGDAAFREKAGSILDRFRERGKTVLIASHSLDLIEKRCDRVFWLDRGALRLEGPAAEVTQAYLEDSRREKSRLGAG